MAQPIFMEKQNTPVRFHPIMRCCFFPVFFIIPILISSCGTSKQLNRAGENSFRRVWDSLDVSSKYHTGLSIYDTQKNKYIFNYREDNFFTPASNTKLFTMYAVLQYMDATIPAAYYQVKNDTMIVWGGGDPGTRYPGIHTESTFINFLKSTDKKIVFSNHHFGTQRFGSGWPWDDYPFPYQSEKTAFPVYGNNLWIERYRDSIVLTPGYFNLVFEAKKDTFESLSRNEEGTQYSYHYDHRIPFSLSSIPVSLFENDIRFIWKEATGKDIFFKDYPFIRTAIKVQGSNRDSILKFMMQESDNFMAEQLLLACALTQTGSMNEAKIIRRILQGPLSKLPDSISWVDGSGLSRYNLMTPRSIIWLLDKIIKQKGIEYMKSILPAGGKSGTLLEFYKSNDKQPYIYAKTGTLSNTHCLSGILVTRSGKELLFSWMNNQFNTESYEVKKSMEKLFIYLRDNY